MREDLKITTQLYNLDAVAYESLFPGTVHHLARPAGQPPEAERPGARL
jgi:hypothetical protein